MKPVTLQQHDGMPREVATAMLSEPRARMTNTFRKQCQRARERVFVSSSTIIRPCVDGRNNKWGMGYSDQAVISPETKMATRFARARLVQLGRWLRRVVERRASIQYKYLAVPNSDSPIVQACFDSARADFSAIANRLDVIRDCVEEEINRRAKQAESIVAIRRGFGSSVDFHFVFCEKCP